MERPGSSGMGTAWGADVDVPGEACGPVPPPAPPRQLSLAAGPLSLASLFQEAPKVFPCSSPTQRPPQKPPRGWARPEEPPSLPPALSGHQVTLAELFLGKVGAGVGPPGGWSLLRRACWRSDLLPAQEQLYLWRPCSQRHCWYSDLFS